MGKWITEEDTYDVRYSELGDLSSLKKWLRHKEVMRWYPLSSLEDVEIMATNWIGFSRYRASLTAIYCDQPVGIATLFLMPYRKLVHHCLMHFIVDPDQSGKGVGTSLLRNIAHLAVNEFRFEKMHIEVYEGCPAVSLLKKGGYREIVKQERAVKEGEHYLARLLFEIELPRAYHISRGEKSG